MADSWEALKQSCMACRACGLAETRTHVVFGDGAQDAEILLIGEGPGQHEDEQGVPFVGRGGQHGQWFERGGVQMTATFHPAALLRDVSKRPDAFEDLKSIQAKIREICKHTEV